MKFTITAYNMCIIVAIYSDERRRAHMEIAMPYAYQLLLLVCAAWQRRRRRRSRRDRRGRRRRRRRCRPHGCPFAPFMNSFRIDL